MTSLISHTTYLRLPYEKNLRSRLRLAFYLQLVCRSHGIPPADRVKEFAVTMNFGFPSPETHLVPMPKKKPTRCGNRTISTMVNETAADNPLQNGT